MGCLLAFFFFLLFGLGSFSPDFFFPDLGVASGVSFGVADAVSSSVFFFAFGEGEAVFAFCVEAFSFALGLGDSVGVGFGLGLGVAEVSLFGFDFCFAVFGFGVGLGDSLGGVVADARGLGDCAGFCSSVNCAWATAPIMAPIASRVASQDRKRATAAERTRARGAKPLQGSRNAPCISELSSSTAT